MVHVGRGFNLPACPAQLAQLNPYGLSCISCAVIKISLDGLPYCEYSSRISVLIVAQLDEVYTFL